MKNYYDLLGVDKNATQKQINDAFKKLSLKFHPDKNGGDSYYVELFQVINEAKQVLSDEAKRIKYDYSLKKSFSGRSFFNTTDEFLQRKKQSAAQDFAKKDSKRVKWSLAVVGLGVVIALILIIVDKGVEYFTRPVAEKAALNIKILKRDSLFNNSQVTDEPKKSPGLVTSNIAISTDSAAKRFDTINKYPKIPPPTVQISDNKQKGPKENKVLELVKPAKKENQVTVSSLSSKSFIKEKTVAAGTKKFAIADTKVISNVLLSTSQMTNILNGILSRKAESGNKINCVKILVTNSSNVINAFKFASFLRANGFIIAGRETIKEKIDGIKIAVYKNCINVTIGNL